MAALNSQGNIDTNANIISCRIAILGHEYGKREVFVRTCFKPQYTSNDMDFSISYMNLNDMALKVKLWQPYVFQDQIRACTSYFANISGLILVYDLNNACTFDSVPSIFNHTMSLVKHNLLQKSPFYCLIGFSDNDIVSSREVSYDRARLLADQYGMLYFEITSTSLMNPQFDFIKSCLWKAFT